MKTTTTILSMMIVSFFLMNSLKAQNDAMTTTTSEVASITTSTDEVNGDLVITTTYVDGRISIIRQEQVTICHLPPGETENCQQITISLDALQYHLDHGDLVYCKEEVRYDHHLDLVNRNDAKIIKVFH